MDEYSKHLLNEHEEKLKGLDDHARIANEEMAIIKTEIQWIKEKIGTIDQRIWYVLSTIILGTIIQIVLKVLIK